jgi:hypothetical protein
VVDGVSDLIANGINIANSKFKCEAEI